jgi:hypothetical protein
VLPVLLAVAGCSGGVEAFDIRDERSADECYARYATDRDIAAEIDLAEYADVVELSALVVLSPTGTVPVETDASTLREVLGAPDSIAATAGMYGLGGFPAEWFGTRGSIWHYRHLTAWVHPDSSASLATVEIGPDVEIEGGGLRWAIDTRLEEIAVAYQTSWACREMHDLSSSVWRAPEAVEALSVRDTTASPFGPVGVAEASLVFQKERLVRVEFL